jgi:aldehyde:ferredoxin oxidoreductase
MGGYCGKILRVNLSTKSFVEDVLDERYVHNFLGGRGIAAKILFEELKVGINPLNPENKIIIMTGPLTGTNIPGSGRVTVSSKSPLTKTLFDSSMGGSFGVHLKRKGYDGLIIEGKAEQLVYLIIDEDEMSIETASHIRGMKTSETESYLRRKYKGSGVVVIGPAGENKVLLANIMSETRTAGRGGLGAVMGSKNLKAIVVRGRKEIGLTQKGAFKDIARKIRRTIETHPITGSTGSLAKFGTSLLIHRMAVADLMPKDNFSENNHMDYEDVDSFSGETINERYLTGRKACYLCPTGCGRRLKIDGKSVKGPEYESSAMLGPNAGFYNFEKEILPLSFLCDELGLDTISIGNILGYARSNNLIKNIEEAKQLISDIALNLSTFSMGVHKADQILNGKGDVACVKSLELPAYDPRKSKGIALAYVTSNRGGCHLRAYTIAPEILSNPEFVDPQLEEGKAELIIKLQNISAVYDSLILCKFHSFALFTTIEYEMDDLAKALSAVTGFLFTNEDLHEIGSRIYTLERLFNIREGFSSKDDNLPKRFDLKLDKMLKKYYQIRDWNVDGHPKASLALRKPEKIKEFDLLLTPLSKITPPQIQVALDMDADIETICNIARKAYAGGARIIEAGTPAIKRHGTDNLIPALRKACPEAIIVADLKTMDVGNLESRIAFRAGADIAGILAVSGMNVIKEALSEAIKNDKSIIIDFIGSKDPLTQLDELTKELHNYEDTVVFCLHRGISDQLKGRGIYEQKQLISEVVKKARGFIVGIAGGIKEGTTKEIASYGIEIFVVGSAIYNSTDPEETTKRMLTEIKDNYVKRKYGRIP